LAWACKGREPPKGHIRKCPFGGTSWGQHMRLAHIYTAGTYITTCAGAWGRKGRGACKGRGPRPVVQPIKKKGQHMRLKQRLGPGGPVRVALFVWLLGHHGAGAGFGGFKVWWFKGRSSQAGRHHRPGSCQRTTASTAARTVRERPGQSDHPINAALTTNRRYAGHGTAMLRAGPLAGRGVLWKGRRGRQGGKYRAAWDVPRMGGKQS
jgi:hypothetical protein